MKSWLEIDAGRLRSNFHAVQAASGPACEVLAVVKANAYGHGVELCAPVLAAAGVHWMGVSDVDEGAAIRAALYAAFGPHSELPDAVRLLVMCGFEKGDEQRLIEQDLTPVIWTPQHLLQLEAAAAGLERRVRVHIEIDTGMARQGVPPGPELQELFATFSRCPHILCEGIFSHLSSSELAGSLQTALQLDRFAHIREPHAAPQLLPELLHLGNTSALDEGSTMRWLDLFADRGNARPMVRAGLALYGYALPLASGAGNAMAEAHLQPQLQSVATWKTRVIGVREIGPGDTVGYGASFTAPRPMRLALLPVGYADGFRREASSGIGDGWVRMAGRRAPVVGRVSMNLTVVDVTGLTCQIGDEVVLLGEGVSAEDHARWCGTIPYEILCAMRGPRTLV